MAKKKNNRKKKGPGKLQHKKLIEKQQKNFIKIIQKIAEASDAEELYYKIPPFELFVLLQSRIGSLRVEKAIDSHVIDKDLKILKKLLLAYMNYEKLTIVEGKPQITLYEYYFSGVSFIHYLRGLKDEQFPEAKEVKEAFKVFTDIILIPVKHIMNYMLIIAWGFSSINRGFLSLKYNFVSGKGKKMYERIIVDIIDPEIKHFKINNSNRPAYRMGVLVKDGILKWTNIKASEINDAGSFGELKFDVYIQSHALKRLEERLDCFTLKDINTFLFTSFYSPKIIKDYKGQILIEIYIFQYKVGYFTAEIVDGAILVKTFLFLTNDGTPEGEKLQELAGLSREGKKYFKIDTLSTFINSDIEKDDTLKELFISAGCGDLFKVQTYRKEPKNEQKTAMALLEYLKIE